MSLHAEMLEQEFTEEMTHRVVRHGARSPEAREALRFAKRHPNPKFLKIARFKVAEQERFDVENGLASPWVRTLHFLDEEVFDRLRLNSIGQVVAVTGLVLGILFLSDRTRSWFHPDEAEGRKPAERAIRAVAHGDPSPVDQWVRDEILKALASPEVRDQVHMLLPANALPAGSASFLADVLRRSVCLQPLAESQASVGTDDEEFRMRLTRALEKSGDSVEIRAMLQKALDDEATRQKLLPVLREIAPHPSSEHLMVLLQNWSKSDAVQNAIRQLVAPGLPAASASVPPVR